MSLFRNNGTNDIEIKTLYRNNGTNDVQTGKIYRNNGTTDVLIYSARSDTYTITATATQTNGTLAMSETIVNTEGYTKMVIDEVTGSGGNYGNNGAMLYCNGVKILSTGHLPNSSEYKNAVKAWTGAFDISRGGNVYVETYTIRDENRDDGEDPISITVTFHFE